MRIAIIAALPGELKPLVRGWERLPTAKGSGISMWRRPEAESSDETVAVCAGMGAAAARRAFTAAEFGGVLDMVLSVGWAGALTDSEDVGLVMSEVIDAQTGECFFLTTGKRKLRVVTTVAVADAREKRRLAQTYGAAMVDMEAATVARLAQMRGIPMVCIKAVSDGLDTRLPDINPFIDVAGQMKMGAFLAHVAIRPQYWGPLVDMGRRTASASNAIASTVEAFLLDPDAERWNRQGGAKV
jgi:adenosylhomocysteine nucleosidase